MNQRALERSEKALGKGHPDTLHSVSTLAVILRYQEKYQEAERLKQRALNGKEALGKDHPNTPVIVNNLALVLAD